MFNKRKEEGYFNILINSYLTNDEDKFREFFRLNPAQFDFVLCPGTVFNINIFVIFLFIIINTGYFWISSMISSSPSDENRNNLPYCTTEAARLDRRQQLDWSMQQSSSRRRFFAVDCSSSVAWPKPLIHKTHMSSAPLSTAAVVGGCRQRHRNHTLMVEDSHFQQL